MLTEEQIENACFMAFAAINHRALATPDMPRHLLVGFVASPDSKLVDPAEAETLRNARSLGLNAVPWGEAIVEVSRVHPEHLRHFRDVPPHDRSVCVIAIDGEVHVRRFPNSLTALAAEDERRKSGA